MGGVPQGSVFRPLSHISYTINMQEVGLKGSYLEHVLYRRYCRRILGELKKKLEAVINNDMILDMACLPAKN